MLVLVQDDLQSVYAIDFHQASGPVIFKALLDCLMNSNHSMIRAIQQNLRGENFRIEDYKGKFLEFCNKISAAVKRL